MVCLTGINAAGSPLILTLVFCVMGLAGLFERSLVIAYVCARNPCLKWR